MKKRALCALLALVLVFGLFPGLSAYAWTGDQLLIPGKYTGYRDWKWPTPGTNTVSCCYLDWDTHSDGHYALDLPATSGSNVYASWEGEVIDTNTSCTHNYGKNASCGCGGGLGNYVYIKHLYHGTWFVSRYGHLSTVKVSKGDKVTKSTVIGTVGSTGWSTGPHLDFRIFEGSTHLDNATQKKNAIDPFGSQFLEMPSGIHVNTHDCCLVYINAAKALYETPVQGEEDPRALSISGCNYPELLTQGSKFSVYGTITSGCNLDLVTVGVFDHFGTFVTGVNQVNPNAKTYDIKASADAKVLFNNLAPGVYYYRVRARNTLGNEDSKQYVFTVLANGRTVEDGIYWIETSTTQNAVSAADHTQFAESNVQLEALSQSPYHLWNVAYVGDGYYRLFNHGAVRAMEVEGGGSANGTNVTLKNQTTDAGLFQILPVSTEYENYFAFVPKCSTKSCLDVNGGNLTPGTNIQIYRANLTSAQVFVMGQTGQYFYAVYVNLDYNDGTGRVDNEYAVYNELPLAASTYFGTPTRDGYVFEGWYTARTGGEKVTEETIMHENDTFYAHWTPAGPCASGHTWNAGVVTRKASCTETGETLFTCSVCGETKTETTPALGHDFETKTTSGACTGYEEITRTCKRCGHVETELNVVNFTDWSTTEPVGVDERLIETKTQYRYSDYQTTTSDQPEMTGWTQIKAEPKYGAWGAWSDWSPNAVADSDTCQVQSDTIYGYYYFLCPNCGAHMHVSTKCYTWAGGCGYSTAFPNNWRQMWSTTSWDKANLSDPYGTGHPFTDTTFSDGRWFKWSDNGSARTGYHYRTRTKTMSYTFERWTSPSAWSDDPIAETPTRKVEMQKLYRYAQGSGDHTWDSGVVTTAPTCQETGVKTYTCTACNATRTEEIPALGHNFRNGVCVNCGLTNVTALLKVGTVSGKAGDVVRVPVSIEQNTGFAGFTFLVSADDALVLTDIAKGDLLSNSDSGAFTKNVRGRLINWTDSENLTGDGVLFYLTFKIADDAEPGSYVISIALKDGQSSNFVNEYGGAIPFEAETGTVTVKAVQPEPVNPFTDVAKGKFYYDPVLWAISQDPQITTGVTNTTFEPDRICTRAHVVTFLWRANGCPDPQSMTSKFKDVKDTSKYYYKAVLWANEQGITTGYSDGTFRPDDECTRGQVVTFLWRAKGSPKPTGVTNPFSDVPTGKYYTNAVLWALKNNITKGRTATTFGPDDACTRGHAVTFLYRAQN